MQITREHLFLSGGMILNLIIYDMSGKIHCRKLTEKARIQYFKKRGYELHVIWEDDLKKFVVVLGFGLQIT